MKDLHFLSFVPAGDGGRGATDAVISHSPFHSWQLLRGPSPSYSQTADPSWLQHDVLVSDEELGHHPAVGHNTGHPIPAGGGHRRIQIQNVNPYRRARNGSMIFECIICFRLFALIIFELHANRPPCTYIGAEPPLPPPAAAGSEMSRSETSLRSTTSASTRSRLL